MPDGQLPCRCPEAAGCEHVWLAGAHRATCGCYSSRVLLRLRGHARLQHLELLPAEGGLRDRLHCGQVWTHRHSGASPDLICKALSCRCTLTVVFTAIKAPLWHMLHRHDSSLESMILACFSAVVPAMSKPGEEVLQSSPQS